MTALISSLNEDERILRELEAQEQNLIKQRGRRRRPLGHSRSEESEDPQITTESHGLRRQMTLDVDDSRHVFDQQQPHTSMYGSKLDAGEQQRIRGRRATSESRDAGLGDDRVAAVTAAAADNSRRHYEGVDDMEYIRWREPVDMSGYFTEPEPIARRDELDLDLDLDGDFDDHNDDRTGGGGGGRRRRKKRTAGRRHRVHHHRGNNRRQMLSSLSDEDADNYSYDSLEEEDIVLFNEGAGGDSDVEGDNVVRRQRLRQLKRELVQKLPLHSISASGQPPPPQPYGQFNRSTASSRANQQPLNDLMAKLDQDNRILAELDRQIERSSSAYHQAPFLQQQQHPLYLHHSDELRLQHHFHPMSHPHPHSATTVVPQQQLFFLPLANNSSNNSNQLIQQQLQLQQQQQQLHRQQQQALILRSLQQADASATQEAKQVLDSILVPNRGRARVYIAKVLSLFLCVQV
jgi:hypothetical protein